MCCTGPKKLLQVGGYIKKKLNSSALCYKQSRVLSSFEIETSKQNMFRFIAGEIFHCPELGKKEKRTYVILVFAIKTITNNLKLAEYCDRVRHVRKNVKSSEVKGF